jgi:hypothetical protein
MSFSYNAVWEDTVKSLRQHAPLFAAIAGVFLFLPALLIAVYLPPPQPPQGVDPQRAFQLVMDYYRSALPWFSLEGLISMVGTLAMLRLVFAQGTTVGGALVFALKLMPFYLLVSIIIGFAIAIGAMLIVIAAILLGPIAVAISALLLIVPLFYFVGRIVPLPAVMVAESRRNPFDALRRTFALTKGHGWAVLGIVAIVVIVAGIVVGTADTMFGLIFVLVAGQELGKLLTAVVASVLSAALATLLVVLYAAIYRALAGPNSVAAAFE